MRKEKNHLPRKEKKRKGGGGGAPFYPEGERKKIEWIEKKKEGPFP